MANLLREIIDCVVGDMNDATFSKSFTAIRAWQYQYSETALDSLRVTLIPAKYEAEHSGRNLIQEQFQFDVVIQQRPGSTENADVDELGDLHQEISDWFHDRVVDTDSGRADVTKVEWPTGAEGGFFPEHLRQFGVFTAVVRVTCVMHRTA